MAYLQSNIPYFKAWVRREYTCNFERYEGEFLHAMVIAVTSMPNRSLSFQVIFTGCESDDTDEPNVHGGAMWARMPITALVGDTPYDEWPQELPPYVAQPWIVTGKLSDLFGILVTAITIACKNSPSYR